MTSPIGAKALRRNEALDPFEVLIGEWDTSGSHPLLPDTPLRGRVSFERIEGGAFVLMRTEVDDERIPDGIAALGSDDDGRYSMQYFDERGVSRHYDLAVRDDGFEWWRDDPEFSQRVRLVVDGDELRTVGSMSRRGGAWEPDLELTYRRRA